MHQTVDIGNSTVVIIGPPASGKTYVANKLAHDNPSHKLIHTDDYIAFGFEPSLYYLLDYVVEAKKTQPLIIEGILGYRLLRKGVQQGNFFPDIVIELEITDEQLTRTYKKERGGTSKLDYIRAMMKSNATVLRSYQLLPNNHLPKFIKLKNSY